MKRPRLVSATRAEIDELVAAAKKTLPAQQAQLLERHLDAFMVMQQSLGNGKMSLEQMRQAVVAALTEGQRVALEELGAKALQGDDEDVPVPPDAPRPPTRG